MQIFLCQRYWLYCPSYPKNHVRFSLLLYILMLTTSLSGQTSGVSFLVEGGLGRNDGSRPTVGIGFRYDVLPYTLALDNPNRHIPDPPLELDRVDVQTFAVLGALGWRF